MFSLKIGRQCTPPPPGMKKLNSQVNMTFWLSGQSDIWFWLMYPPPGMEKLKSQGQSDILVLADVPPPGMEKLKSQGQSDILVLADVPPPPPEIEIGLNMNAIEQT